MRTLLLTAICAFALAFALPVTAQDQETVMGDAELGAKVFKKCIACHKVGEKAKNGVGPLLNGVVDNSFGTIEGYKYSKSLLNMAEEGAVWDQETLDAYLTKPRSVIPKGKMAFAGLKKPEDRANVIEYLRQFSPPAEEAAQ